MLRLSQLECLSTDINCSRYGEPNVDQTITQLENKVISQNQVGQVGKAMGKVDLGRSGKKPEPADEEFPYRPSFGTAGRAVTVWANYFKVNVNVPVLWRYNLEHEQKTPPAKAGTKLKGRKLALTIQKVVDHFKSGTRALATEYSSQIISLDKLKVGSEPLMIELPRESGDEKDVIQVTIIGPTELRMGELQKYLTAQDRGQEKNAFPRFPECVDALNIILSTHPRGLIDDISVVGNARYFPFGGQTPQDFVCSLMADSGRPLQASRGFFQSMRIGTGRLLLNTNVTCGVFRVSGPLHDIFQRLGWNLSEPQAAWKVRQGAGLLAKARVSVRFKDSKGTSIKRNKAIYGLVTRRDYGRGGKDQHPVVITSQGDYPGPAQIKFWLQEESGEGRYVTVADHFKRKYNMALKNFPVVNVGNLSKPVFFPAEVIEILPGQAVKAKLTGTETSNMLLHACKLPKENASILENLSRGLLHIDNGIPASFGVEVDKKLLAVHARILEAPTIQYGGGGRGSTMRPANGSWNMSNVKVFRGARIDRWACFQISSYRSQGLVPRENLEEFVATAGKMGMQLSPPVNRLEDIRFQNAADLEQALTNKFKWAQTNQVRFILFIFSPIEDKDGAYGMIKTLGDCKFGIHTSCIVESKFIRNTFKAPYFSNVLLKWNLKAGGVNHKLSQDVALIREGKTMVVGYDVTHPTNMPGGGKDKAGNLPPSLVGIVSSVDKDLGQWPSTIWEQTSKQEMLDDQLVGGFKACLTRWEGGKTTVRKPLPENIIIFRDGVSEGQFKQVLDHELPKIKKACGLKYPANGPMPKFTIIVSVKRHQTRFYPAQRGQESKSGNIECGTIVDRDVTQARYWDFYLTAHTALQGTARPAHYTVLRDEIFRSKFQARAADELEKLTHEMCYLFGRATKAISICPPAYYADIVCERARLHRPHHFDVDDNQSQASGPHAHNEPLGSVVIHENLKDSMYYI